MASQSLADCVIITPLEEELEAVCAKLPGIRELDPESDNILACYEANLPVTFSDSTTATYRIVVIIPPRKAQLKAQAAATDAIQRWRPRCIILVGIAGGNPDEGVRLGDVLIADHVVYYEEKKVGDEGLEHRPKHFQPDTILVEACQRLDRKPWREGISVERPGPDRPRVLFGSIASGNKVIASEGTLDRFVGGVPVIGVEMEAAAVASVARRIPFLMVRAVSDLSDKDKDSGEVKRWRSYACDVAATFTVALLQSGLVRLDEREPSRAEEAGSKAGQSSEEPDEARLRRYLPARLLDDFLAGRNSSAALRVTEHLYKLLETVCTYRATPILAEAQPIPHRAQGRWLDAALLFADISGFMVMSESLGTTRSRTGAEEIARVVNDYFSIMVDIVHRYDGFVAKFGGDALFAMFEGPAKDSVLRATQAGLDIQRRVLSFSNSPALTGRARLRVNLGVHTGRVFAAHIGDEKQMEYWVVGKDVSMVAMAESAASVVELGRGGQVIATEAAIRHLRNKLEFEALQLESALPDVPFFSVPTTQRLPSPPSWPLSLPPPLPRDIGSLLDCLDMTTPYLPPGVLRRIVPLPEKRRIEGEHRLATALFINIEGLGQLAELLGEARSHLLWNTLQDCFTTIRTIVELHGGIVNKVDLCTQGDRIFAVFGVPKAHEDDDSQAAKAALEIRAAIGELNQRLAERCQDITLRLQLRMGLATGHVFSGNIGAETCQEYTIMGDAVNLAAQLMATAPWGEIWVSERAYLRLRDFGDFEFAGEHKVKGKGLLSAYRLLHLDKSFRLQPTFVDREGEVYLLQQQLQEMSKMRLHGCIVVVRGDRGIGKSRLWQQAIEWAEDCGYRCLWGSCSERGATYQLFADILQQYLEIQDTDDQDLQQEKLAQGIGYLLGKAAIPYAAPYLASVLGLPLREEWKSEIRSLQEHNRTYLQKRIAGEIVDLLKEIAQQAPLLVVCEDLHWLDDDSAIILGHLIESVASMPRLMLGLSLIPGNCPHYDQLVVPVLCRNSSLTKYVELGPLAPDYCYQIVQDVLMGHEISETQRDRIFQASEGNPLFLVENARNLSRNPEAEISDELQKVVESRIDDLPDFAQGVLSAAAVIGSRFSIEELCYVLGEEPVLGQGLVLLQNVYLITPRERDYHFVHQWTREVAYSRQSRESRRNYHQRLGEYWAPRQPAKAADHYFTAELWSEALDLGVKAGEICLASFANVEGIRLYRQALQAARELGDAEAQIRLCQQLGDLHYRVGQYEEAVKYYDQQLQGLQAKSAPAGEQAVVHCSLGAVYCRWGLYEQALEELKKGLSLVGPSPSSIRAKLLSIRCIVLRSKKDLVAAERDGQEAVALAAEFGEPLELAYAHNNLAAVYADLDQFERALVHHQQALEIRQSHSAASQYEIAQSLENVGTELSNLKRYSEALPYYERALEIQQRISDPFGEGSVLQNWACLHRDLGQLEAAEAKFLRALELWSGIDYRKGMAFARQDLGTLYQEQEQWGKALEYLDEAVRLYEPLGIYDHLSETCLARAKVLWQLEQPAKARKAAQMALRFAKKVKVPKRKQELVQEAQEWLEQFQDG